ATVLRLLPLCGGSRATFLRRGDRGSRPAPLAGQVRGPLDRRVPSEQDRPREQARPSRDGRTASSVAPAPTATGPRRQYRWPPTPISSGPQAFKYSLVVMSGVSGAAFSVSRSSAH